MAMRGALSEGPRAYGSAGDSAGAKSANVGTAGHAAMAGQAATVGMGDSSSSGSSGSESAGGSEAAMVGGQAAGASMDASSQAGSTSSHGENMHDQGLGGNTPAQQVGGQESAPTANHDADLQQILASAQAPVASSQSEDYPMPPVADV